MRNESNQEDLFLAWLRDAYAMEQGVGEILERQVKQLDDVPEVRMMVQQHLEQTKSQAERVKQCVESLGESVSNGKSMMANMIGAMQGMSTAMSDDKVVKNALANHALEHFEMACYLSLSSAAKELGHDNIAKVCETIMQEEIAMANWFEKQIPLVTRHELYREAQH